MAKLAIASAILAAAAVATSASEVTAPDAWPTQVPFWPQYPSRGVQVLTGTWAFGFSDSIDPVAVPYSGILTPNTTSVPGAFDVAPPGIMGPRGTAFFRSSHTCTPGAAALLKFYAVNFYARVFVDGNEIGNHTAGGYTPFEMVAPACTSSGTREVALVTSNKANYTTNPTNTNGDFYFYSGIIRPVIVTELPTTDTKWIDRVDVVSKDYVKGLIELRVAFGGSTTDTSAHLSISINGGSFGAFTAYPIVNSTCIIPNVAVPNFKLWTLGQDNTQNLFTVAVQDSQSKDTLMVRSGLRVLGIDQPTARITINGEIVKLLGFNRHTMWPDTGAAVTQEQEAADLALVKSLNANYIRGAHYPQSQSWLDMLDVAGVAIWEETLGPGTSTKDMSDPWFMSNHLTAVTSMVLTSFNHPAVIFHAFFNEGPSNDPAACIGYAASARTIKELVSQPAMRMVTWANNKLTSDACIAYEDVISFNSYPGWYDHPSNVTYPPSFWQSQVDWVVANWPDTPLTISETGGGGIYEWRNDTTPFPGLFWSQSFQKNLVPVDAAFAANNSRLTGITLWQFADIKANDQSTQSCGQCVYAQNYPNLTMPWDCAYISQAQIDCGRPGGYNHKGVVDFWRRQKEDFPILAQIYGNKENWDELTQRK